MKLWKILGVELYEVGDIFINMSGNNPGNRFKGTWSLIAQGRTLVGVDTSQSEFNSVRKTGGDKTHTLTVAQMPNHAHSMKWLGGAGGASISVINWTGGQTAWQYVSTEKAGDGQAHNNLQPYLTTYIWERVS